MRRIYTYEELAYEKELEIMHDDYIDNYDEYDEDYGDYGDYGDEHQTYNE